jgi:hypothetical protein
VESLRAPVSGGESERQSYTSLRAAEAVAVLSVCVSYSKLLFVLVLTSKSVDLNLPKGFY